MGKVLTDGNDFKVGIVSNNRARLGMQEICEYCGSHPSLKKTRNAEKEARLRDEPDVGGDLGMLIYFVINETNNAIRCN